LKHKLVLVPPGLRRNFTAVNVFGLNQYDGQTQFFDASSPLLPEVGARSTPSTAQHLWPAAPRPQVARLAGVGTLQLHFRLLHQLGVS